MFTHKLICAVIQQTFLAGPPVLRTNRPEQRMGIGVPMASRLCALYGFPESPFIRIDHVTLELSPLTPTRDEAGNEVKIRLRVRKVNSFIIGESSSELHRYYTVRVNVTLDRDCEILQDHEDLKLLHFDTASKYISDVYAYFTVDLRTGSVTSTFDYEHRGMEIKTRISLDDLRTMEILVESMKVVDYAVVFTSQQPPH